MRRCKRRMGYPDIEFTGSNGRKSNRRSLTRLPHLRWGPGRSLRDDNSKLSGDARMVGIQEVSDGEKQEGNRRSFAHHPRTYPKEQNRSLGPLESGPRSFRMTARGRKDSGQCDEHCRKVGLPRTLASSERGESARLLCVNEASFMTAARSRLPADRETEALRREPATAPLRTADPKGSELPLIRPA